MNFCSIGSTGEAGVLKAYMPSIENELAIAYRERMWLPWKEFTERFSEFGDAFLLIILGFLKSVLLLLQRASLHVVLKRQTPCQITRRKGLP